MSWIYRVHLIVDREIIGIDERIDRLISLQLHYHGEVIISRENKTEKYCYTAEYEPLLGFISNDYHEMDILQQRMRGGSIWGTQDIGKTSDDTVPGMERVFRQILLSHEHFHVFFSYLYADADIRNGKVFFETVLKNKKVYKCGVTKAQDIFIKLLDFNNPHYDGRMFYASENDATIFDYMMVYPRHSFGDFDDLPITDGGINLHNILFQVERD